MNPNLFRDDLFLIPESFERLAGGLDAGEITWPIQSMPQRIVLLGMGSSYFASLVVAARMRSLGINAVAQRSSTVWGWPPAKDLLVVAVSATGKSIETLDAVQPHLGVSHVVALTNSTNSSLADCSDDALPMLAGIESGGVACRTYRHTIAALLELGAQLTNTKGPAEKVRHAAEATADLLGRHDAWLPAIGDLLETDEGTWLLAPQERVSSALQGALMIREGPRRRADGCETGDWSHVDVYLSKTLDYRAIVFLGSRYETRAAEWMTSRESTAVAVGGTFAASSYELRYRYDDDPLVALLVETLVPEMLASSWWLRST